MIENIIIKDSCWRETDAEILFGDEPVFFSEATDLPSLMVEIGAFESKSQARKAGRIGDIPNGFTFEMKANKKMRIWIWNPTE